MIRRLLVGLLLLVALLAGGAYLLPQQVAVSRSIEISAPPAKVFELVNGYKRFNEWSPWFEKDPAAKYTYSGPDTGQGAKMAWASDKADVGSGSQEIVESVPDKLVRTKLDFGEMGKSIAKLDLEPAASGTRVTWGFETDVGMNPMMRWMGLMFDTWIGGDYEKGLAKLKAVAEKP